LKVEVSSKILKMKSHFHTVDSFGPSKKSVRKQGKIERSEKKAKSNLCSRKWAWV